MNPALNDNDLREQRHLRQRRRLACPAAPVAPETSAAHEPPALGYPRKSLLARALLPLALAFLLFLLNHAASSEASNPRGPAHSECLQ